MLNINTIFDTPKLQHLTSNRLLKRRVGPSFKHWELTGPCFRNPKSVCPLPIWVAETLNSLERHMQTQHLKQHNYQCTGNTQLAAHRSCTTEMCCTVTIKLIS